MSFINEVEDFFDSLAHRFKKDLEKHRKEDQLSEEERGRNQDDVIEKVRIAAVDFHATPNAARNQCQKYDLVRRGLGTPIVRRGGVLSLTIELFDEVDLKKKHKLKLVLNFGPQPHVHKGTQVTLEVRADRTQFSKPLVWDIRVESVEGNKITVELQIPPHCPVGIWRPMFEVTNRKDSKDQHILKSETLIYILFNPWCKDDEVYMRGEENRQEYILNDVGKVWVGSYPTASGRQWVFGQFDDVVLPGCVLLMERSGLSPEVRGDPVRVSRAISKMVNSNDDNGVVMGRWDGKYDDGTSPSVWSGSIRIIEEYVKTGKPVRYGQCWVFAGVTNTVCRALGLPARVVTNLNSAHDTNASLTIDQYFDEKGEEINSSGVTPDGASDSIWNFHVWNDVWMARADLPSGYGGWQAIDATPQETSNGMFQCGPASHEAIRRGQIELNYDVAFLLAEVNADVVHWQKDAKEKDGYKMLWSEENQVGVQILTKKPGPLETDAEGRDALECTKDYKAKDDSCANRIVLTNAASKTLAARQAFRLHSQSNSDLEFKIQDLKRVEIGQDFKLEVKIKNKSKETRTVYLLMSASSEFYTGIKSETIKREEKTVVLKAKESTTEEMPVSYMEYWNHLVEYGMMRLVIIANVDETSQTWFGDDQFQVNKPDIKVKCHSSVSEGEVLPVRFSFTNPLHVVLKNCTLVVDGPGLTRPKNISMGDVLPKSKMEYKLDLFPKSVGPKTLVVTFNSNQLVDLTGHTKVVVTSPR